MSICLRLLTFVVLCLSLPAYAQDAVTVGGQTKRTFGTPIAFESGDIACYLTLKDDRGATFREMADFDLCAQERALKGKRVALTYRAQRVQSASCQGNPDCKKTDTVILVVAAKPAPLAGATPPAASPAGQASFCTPQEVVVFSCRTGAKMVSVCASKDAGPTKGYVQYRFGKPDSREPLELTLPEGQTPPPRAATGQAVPFSGGGGAWMRFAKGQVAYTVYTGIGNWGPRGEKREKAGLAVERAGKHVAVLKCNNPSAVRGLLGPDWFEKVGLKPGNLDFDFPD